MGETSLKPLVPILPNPSNNDSTSSWNETNASLKNYNYNPYDTNATGNMTANLTINDSIFNDSRAHISNVESTKNDLSDLESDTKLSRSKEDEQMKIVENEIEKEIQEIEQEDDAENTINEEDMDRDDELYSTANNESMILAENVENTLEQSSQLTFSEDVGTEWLTFNDCLIAFMTSTKNFYLQFKDFDEKIEEIQPIVDDCLDPFDLSVTPLCVGQFQEDELFYRCRVIKWLEDSETVTVSFIDFGNTENILTETVTAMAPELLAVKPLVIRCQFESDINPEAASFKNFEKIVNNECKLTIKVKKADYDGFYASMEKDSEAVLVKLFLENGVEINEHTLKNDNLWNFDKQTETVS